MGSYLCTEDQAKKEEDESKSTLITTPEDLQKFKMELNTFKLIDPENPPSDAVLLDFLVSKDTPEVRKVEAECRKSVATNSKGDAKINKTVDKKTEDGAKVYSFKILEAYDAIVSLNSKFFWGITFEEILDFYNQNISANHLEVGVGSGYYLRHCTFPNEKVRLELLDLNPVALEYCKQHLHEKYNPVTHEGNILEKLDIKTEGFDSIGMNFVLHCVPGDIEQKSRKVCENIVPYLKDGGVLFGSTILYLEDWYSKNISGKLILDKFNNLGIFHNYEDQLKGLEAGLVSVFQKKNVQIKLVGSTAVFICKLPSSGENSI